MTQSKHDYKDLSHGFDLSAVGKDNEGNILYALNAGEVKAIQHALRIADRLKSGEVKILQKVIDECEDQMSRSEHRKKVAAMDYHTSEEQHQDGRWHCANDISEWAAQLIKDIEDV